MGRPANRFLDVQLANGNGYVHHGYASLHVDSAISPLRLNTRDDSTRVQLQSQRLKEQRTAAVVGSKIPGYKTSAGGSPSSYGSREFLPFLTVYLRTAFFASLRTNLRLHASPPPSPMSTPPSMVGSAASLPPPSPLAAPADSAADIVEPGTQEDPLAGVPELKSYITTDDHEKVDALKLVADSVAQMRQTANHTLIFHPLNMAIAIAVISLIARYMYDAKYDISLVGTTCAGIIMTMLALCRYATQNYLYAAEDINWAWLGDADILITKFGEEVIGTLVLDWVSGESRQKRKKAWKGEIRAWTVRLRYRRKGVGTALLEDAVKELRKKGAESIEFADDHASKFNRSVFPTAGQRLTLYVDSKRVLPSIYNRGFDKRERKGRELLQDLLEASPSRGKRK